MKTLHSETCGPHTLPIQIWYYYLDQTQRMHLILYFINKYWLVIANVQLASLWQILLITSRLCTIKFNFYFTPVNFYQTITSNMRRMKNWPPNIPRLSWLVFVDNDLGREKLVAYHILVSMLKIILHSFSKLIVLIWKFDPKTGCAPFKSFLNIRMNYNTHCTSDGSFENTLYSIYIAPIN